MGFRYRKRIKLFPGVWFNLSKRGISTSIGGKGLTVNLKDGKTMTTTSLPGTGLSYRETTDTPGESAPGRTIPAWVWVLLMVAVVVFLVR